MKVNGSANPQQQAELVRSRRAPLADHAREQRAHSAESRRSEAVAVSDVARALMAAREPEQPDESRIERLREMLENDTFEIDPEAIALGLLRDEV